MSRLTMEEILDETIENFSKNPLGEIKKLCVTRDDGSLRLCAIGRCLSFPRAWEGRVFPSNIETELRPRYRGHPTWFWQALAVLHDCRSNWIVGHDRNQLSRIGKSWVHFMRTKAQASDDMLEVAS